MEDRQEPILEFVGGLAHDVNNKLQAAYSLTRDWTLRGQPCPVEHLRAINLSLEAATEQLRHLTDLSRSQNQALAGFEFDEILKSVEILVRPTLERAGISFEVDFEPGLKLSMGNRIDLMDLFLNLLLNARNAVLKRTGGPSHIRLEARLSSGSEIVLKVEDSGVGMEAEGVSGLLEGRWGDGFGLRRVDEVVRSYGGHLACRSNSEGTVFVVSIPNAK